MSWSTAASSCRAAERSCWPTPKYAAPTSAPDGAEALSQEHHQDRDSPTPKPGSYRTVGAPAPGAKVFWFDSLSHRGRCSYVQIGILLHQNRGSPRTVGAPAPGAKGFGPGLRGVSRRAVLRPDNRIH